MSAWAAILVFTIAFVFIATDRVNKAAVALIGAGAMAVTGLIPGSDVFFSQHNGIDWNVIFLLLGMMIIVAIIRQTGLFDYLGIWAAKKSRGHPYRLMVVLMTITAITSPILDNVTIIMLVVPVTIVVCDRLDIGPEPYIIAEVLASNIGGASTLIGDPPNIIIASRAGFSFNDFLIHMAPIAAVTFGLFVLLTRVLFRKSFEYKPDRVPAVLALRERRAITDTKLLVKCLIVLGLIIAAFSLHTVIGLEPSIVALVGAGVMMLVAYSSIEVSDVLHNVEWETLVFLMGLFVMVAGLGHTGVIEQIGQWAVAAVGGNYTATAATLTGGSAVLGAVFDNIPYAATMAPIVETLASQTTDPNTANGLWWAFVIGTDFGGNGTAIAASANVVAIGLAARAGHPISFWQFTRYGLVTLVFTVIIGWGYVWLRYFM